MFNPVVEVHFWSGIMRNHSEFMITALSPKEIERVKWAEFYKNTFTILEAEAKAAQSNPARVHVLIHRSILLLTSFIQFKRDLLGRPIEHNMKINLTPNFFKHMMNEASEYYKTLCMIQADVSLNSSQENIQLHKIWLPDVAWHAASIAADLNPIDTILINEVDEYKNIFNYLFVNASELGIMLQQACLDDGSLHYLNEQVEKFMTHFICFLYRIRELGMEGRVLGVLQPLVLDHMIREGEYYLFRLQKVGMK